MKKKNIFVILRWIIAFIILLIFIQNNKLIFDSPLILTIFIIYATSTFALNFVSEKTFEKQWLNYFVFILDTIFVSAGIYYTGGMDSNFYLVYFLTILMSAIGQNINTTFIISTAGCLMYGFIIFKTGGSIQTILEPAFLIRLPFFYIIALSSSIQSQEIHEKKLKLIQIEKYYDILATKTFKTSQELFDTNKQLIVLTEYNEHILRCITNGLIVINQKGIITNFNLAAEKILRITSNETINKPILSIPFLSGLGEKLINNIAEYETKEEMVISTPLGISIPLEIKYSALKDYENNTIGSLCIFNDLTLEKEMQEELRMSQRLSALGEITVLVAHEIRNPIQAIVSIVDILDKQIDASDPRKKYTEFILEQSSKLTDLIVDVLSFTKPPSLELKENQINTIILKTIRSFEGMMNKKGIKFELKLSEKLPLEKVDVQKLDEVFSNILLNAIQAAGDNGHVKILSFFDDKNVFVNFIDNGKGIPPQNLKKIFDPFFSTKPMGTGLGLPISQKIIEAHGGQIKAWSNQKDETSFQIVLPRKN